jgi:general secretion pathway protein F
MAQFSYRALDGDGRLVSGRLEAASHQAVIDHLSASGLLPVEAAEGPGAMPAFAVPAGRARRRIPQGHLVLFTRKLAAVVQAGLDLDKALEIAGQASNAPQLKQAVAVILADIRAGKAFSEALATYEDALPRYYVPMVRAGEAGGTLGPAIARIAALMERGHKLRQSITSALVYPTILVLTALGSIVLLMTVVIPRFEPLFRDAGRELPLITRIFMGASETIVQQGPVILLALLIGLLLLRYKRQDRAFRQRSDGWILRLPLAGAAVLRFQVAIMARSLGMLLQNGVSLLAALSIVETSLGNAALAAALREARLAVKDGAAFSTALQQSGLFPDLLIQLVAVGEASGRLAEMLVDAGTSYDDDTQTSIQRLLALLTPLVTLGLSMIIAAIIGSVLVAIISVNDLVL